LAAYFLYRHRDRAARIESIGWCRLNPPACIAIHSASCCGMSSNVRPATKEANAMTVIL
jgi:hypothetical protein